MTTQGQEGVESIAAGRPAIQLPRLRWRHLLSFALNFHWAALLLIILPSQVFKIAGDAHKGVALAFELVPGAFVSLFANPLFGLFSDRTAGKLAVWGRRRPYIHFHALLPDTVPAQQRGLASGIMSVLATGGTIAGALTAGLFVAASRPLPAYEHGLWLAYALIIAILVALMLITIIS